jgi:hypothetical protein
LPRCGGAHLPHHQKEAQPQRTPRRYSIMGGQPRGHDSVHSLMADLTFLS